MAALVNEARPELERVPDPGQAADLRRLEALYAAATAPARPEQIHREIAELALAYPAQRASAEELALRIAKYAEALEHVPIDVLRRACLAAIRRRTFFPAPSEILAECGEANLRAWRLFRIRHLIARHERDWRAPAQDAALSPAEQARVDAWLRARGIAPVAA